MMHMAMKDITDPYRIYIYTFLYIYIVLLFSAKGILEFEFCKLFPDAQLVGWLFHWPFITNFPLLLPVLSHRRGHS